MYESWMFEASIRQSWDQSTHGTEHVRGYILFEVSEPNVSILLGTVTMGHSLFLEMTDHTREMNPPDQFATHQRVVDTIECTPSRYEYDTMCMHASVISTNYNADASRPSPN